LTTLINSRFTIPQFLYFQSQKPQQFTKNSFKINKSTILSFPISKTTVIHQKFIEASQINNSFIYNLKNHNNSPKIKNQNDRNQFSGILGFHLPTQILQSIKRGEEVR